MPTPTAATITKDFIRTRDHVDVTHEEKWVRAVFGCIMRAARKNPTFIIDDVWDEMESAARRGRLERTRLDTRILGVMLRFLSSVEIIQASGYYVKSERPGSRPVMVWDSLVYAPRRVAA